MSDPQLYTVGWICALTTEYVAARTFLDAEHSGPLFVSCNDNNDYTLGRIGRHYVVITILPDVEHDIAGAASSASVARDMLHSFPNIRIGLMVGTGGAAPSAKHDIRLGDIVVSAARNGTSAVFQYGFGKVIQSQEFRTSPLLNQPPPVLRAAMTALKARYEADDHQIASRVDEILTSKRRLHRDYSRPLAGADILFRAHVVHPEGAEVACGTSCNTNAGNVVNRPERDDEEDCPKIYHGPIASADQSMEDAQIRDRIAQDHGVLCFDSGAASIVTTFPCLVIRGISDYSDSHKTRQWQGYAAMVAAAYAKDLLNRIAPNKVEVERMTSGGLHQGQPRANEATHIPAKAELRSRARAS